MVSTRQSSIVASSSAHASASTSDATASGSSASSASYGCSSGGSGGGGCSLMPHAGGGATLPHAFCSGKLLRSGPIHMPPLPHAEISCSVVAVTPAPSLLDLPQEVLEKIFSHLGFKQVAYLRQVCRSLDKVCQSILNSSFQRLQTQMLQRFQSIKAKMPRRESARRNHPLACESDIIETLHMRLTLLQMTFGKHIERKHCCFFAGEILDEVYRILHYIKVTTKLARPYKVTDELFDLTTMAMEFFKENIEPTLPEIAYFGTDFIELTFNGSGSSPSNKYFSLDSPPHGSKGGYESPASGNELPAIEAATPARDRERQTNLVLRKRIRKIKQGMKRYNSQLSVVRRDLRTSKSKMAEQQKTLMEYTGRLDEYDKKNEETARKFSTLLQELNKCKTELQYWRSRIPAIQPMCHNCGHVSLAPTPTPSDDHHVNISEPGLSLGLNVDNNLPLEGIEFPAEASTSNEEDLWKLYETKNHDKMADKMADKDTAKMPEKGSGGGRAAAASGKGKGMKRRATEDQDQPDGATHPQPPAPPPPKKSKRALKVRSNSKRVKT